MIASPRKRLGLALAALSAGLVLLVLPASALAHATLEGTVPERGAVVKAQPDAVVFRFNQTVEGNFGAVRVFNSRGQRADAGDAFHPGGNGPQLGVHLQSHVAQGTYTATYRVVSADGHVVSGGFVFSIGKAGAAPGQTVAQLTAGSKSGAPTQVAFSVARGLQYLAIALAIGAAAFLVAVWLPSLRETAGSDDRWRLASERLAGRLRRLLLWAAVIGALSAAAGVVLEGAEAAAVSGWSALKPAIVSEVLATRFGTMWGLAVAAWAVLGALAWLLLGTYGPRLRPAELGATGLIVTRPRSQLPVMVAVLPIAFLAVMPALSGHASSESPSAVLFPLDVVHVVAMSVWLGGLAMLLLALPAATRMLDPPDRTRLLAAAVGRFSTLALAAVLAIAATGVVQAYLYVRSFDNLLHTKFGVAVLIKAALLLALIALGAYNRQRSVPRLRLLAETNDSPGRSGLLLRRALRAEVAVLVVVIGVTAALTTYAPPISAQSGPFNQTTNIGPVQLQMTVDPARVGSNQIHLYLLNPKDGTQFAGAQEVDLAESLPAKRIGPLNQGAFKAGPGHYIVQGALLSVPGTWQLRVTLLVSKFDEYTATVKVPIR